MPECPKRYDASSDTFVYVDQEWVDFVQREFQKFGKARNACKEWLASWQPEKPNG